jgi:hypothetical protein
LPEALLRARLESISSFLAGHAAIRGEKTTTLWLGGPSTVQCKHAQWTFVYTPHIKYSSITVRAKPMPRSRIKYRPNDDGSTHDPPIAKKNLRSVPWGDRHHSCERGISHGGIYLFVHHAVMTLKTSGVVRWAITSNYTRTRLYDVKFPS